MMFFVRMILRKGSLLVFTRRLVLFTIVGIIIMSLLKTQETRILQPRTVAEQQPNTSHPTNYWIRTEGCTVLKYDLYHESIIHLLNEPFPKIVCATKRQLTEESKTNVIFHKENIPDYVSANSTVNCSYQAIVRISQDPLNYDRHCDSQYKLLDKIPLVNRTTAIKDDAIYVTCDDKKKGVKNPVYKNVHHFVQPQRAEKKRQKFKAAFGERGPKPDKLSLIFMGFDSISRSHFRRAMPKAFDYLTNKLEAMELYGYHKVGLNTFPTTMPLLMGLTTTELKRHKCQIEKKHQKYDGCPIFWKPFIENGYVTSFGEDLARVGIFNIDGGGFVEQPTEYYTRPSWLFAERNIGHNGGTKRLREVCHGPLGNMEVVQNFSLAVAEELQDVPSLGFYWLSLLLHDNLNSCKQGDETTSRYFRKLHEMGVFEHTILFFVSDHGQRVDSIRTTYIGGVEDRQPYVFMVFPKWFKEKYPEAMKNLEINTRRVTSPFDIYNTLLDLGHQNYINPRERSLRLQHGQSLFLEVPSNRTCRDAHIPYQFCACQDSKDVSLSDPHLSLAANKTVQEVNRDLKFYPQCAQLSLDKVLKGRISTPKESTKSKKQSVLYSVTFITKPGGAAMESIVEFYNEQYELDSEVSRVNRFGNQSHCIDDATLKNYCYCVDLL